MFGSRIITGMISTINASHLLSFLLMRTILMPSIQTVIGKTIMKSRWDRTQSFLEGTLFKPYSMAIITTITLLLWMRRTLLLGRLRSMFQATPWVPTLRVLLSLSRLHKELQVVLRAARTTAISIHYIRAWIKIRFNNSKQTICPILNNNNISSFSSRR